jgi:hypothetical protein
VPLRIDVVKSRSISKITNKRDKKLTTTRASISIIFFLIVKEKVFLSQNLPTPGL